MKILLNDVFKKKKEINSHPLLKIKKKFENSSNSLNKPN